MTEWMWVMWGGWPSSSYLIACAGLWKKLGYKIHSAGTQLQ
jgi:hypothetical protein